HDFEVSGLILLESLLASLEVVEPVKYIFGCNLDFDGLDLLSLLLDALDLLFELFELFACWVVHADYSSLSRSAWASWSCFLLVAKLRFSSSRVSLLSWSRTILISASCSSLKTSAKLTSKFSI